VYLQDTGAATTRSDRSSAATAAAPPPSTRGRCTRAHTDRHMARRGDLLPAPPGRRAEAHAHPRTHARSRTHAPTPPPACRHYTRAHTARHTAGQPTACAGRDAMPRHTRTHAPTQPHPRISTAHRGPAEAAPQECSAPGRGGPAASSRRSRVHIQRRSSGSGGVAGRRPVRRPGGTLSAISAEEARSVDSDQIDGCWLTIPAKKVIHPETARLSNTGGGR
jgi:hypothetical protein